MDEFRGDVQKLFESYRSAHPDLEGSANFMPNLWERIDARKSALHVFRRMTQVFVSLSAATALFLGAFLIPNAEKPGGHYADIVDADTTEEQVLAAAAPITPSAPPSGTPALPVDEY